MIYVSSTCVKHERIKESIDELARNGFKNIELSGGTKYYQGYEEDLLALKDKYNLNYLLHNYFPPPKEDFILNLASLDDGIYKKSVEFYEKAISLSKRIGSKKFGLHAGFFIDFDVRDIGRDIPLNKLCDKDKAIKRFCSGYKHLKEMASDIELYIENNVLSYSNIKTFQGQSPFMLIDHNGYLELRNLIDFKLLLDVAHLRVSANSLGLDFVEQLNKTMPISDYVHLSDNNGAHDQNRSFGESTDILNILEKFDFNNRTLTIETYSGIFDLKLSQSIISRLLCQPNKLEPSG